MKTTKKLGIIGMSPGNGHPYSWTAIFNGYNKKKMAKCPFPVIPEYLAEQKPEDFGIDGTKITHIWTQDSKISRHIADSSLIPNVVDNMTDMIGKVDAVVLARDDGENHLKMAKPFIEAGIPIFIDKPLTDQAEDLKVFVKYYKQGKVIMSCSSMRYSGPVIELKKKQYLGHIMTASAVTPKYWRTYGIHMIEGIYAVMGGGIESVQNVGDEKKDIVHIKYQDGRHAVIQAFAAIKNGAFSFHGTEVGKSLQGGSSFLQFKNMLVHFVKMLNTGKPCFPWQETVEMAKVVIAGEMSLKQNGKIIKLTEVI